jgi:hypothetical protein
MSKVNVNRLAHDANIDIEYHASIGRDPVWIATQDELERFAALVLEEGRERNLAAASEACRSFGKAGAVLMAAIRAKVSQ